MTKSGRRVINARKRSIRMIGNSPERQARFSLARPTVSNRPQKPFRTTQLTCQNIDLFYLQAVCFAFASMLLTEWRSWSGGRRGLITWQRQLPIRISCNASATCSPNKPALLKRKQPPGGVSPLDGR
jgi:hypothetical protein